MKDKDNREKIEDIKYKKESRHAQRRQPAEAGEDTVTAYFDLEFCNERISRHNVPIAIGVTYRKGDCEIATYDTLIWCGDEMELWEEQLDIIGYQQQELKSRGKSMEEVTEDLLALQEKYKPHICFSFGKQDDQLLHQFLSQELPGWNYADAIPILGRALGMKYEISLEKYAYICGVDFVHEFQPLADARSLADILDCVRKKKTDEQRRVQVVKEYDRKIFLIQYQNRKQAYEYLSGLPVLLPKQKDKLKSHKRYLKQNLEKYKRYMHKN